MRIRLSHRAVISGFPMTPTEHDVEAEHIPCIGDRVDFPVKLYEVTRTRVRGHVVGRLFTEDGPLLFVDEARER